MLVKAYSINHGLNVKDFVDDYMVLLKKSFERLVACNRMEKEG